MSRKIRTKATIYSMLSLAILCFIFSQSILSREDSGALSGRILALLKPLLDPQNRIDEDLLHLIIRKTAHFTEFAALGLCVTGATSAYGVIRKRRYVALPLLITLVCAVCDEFLQYFTGRGSMVTDVVLDFAGALFGMMWMSAIYIFKYKRKQ